MRFLLGRYKTARYKIQDLSIVREGHARLEVADVRLRGAQVGCAGVFFYRLGVDFPDRDGSRSFRCLLL